MSRDMKFIGFPDVPYVNVSVHSNITLGQIVGFESGDYEVEKIEGTYVYVKPVVKDTSEDWEDEQHL